LGVVITDPSEPDNPIACVDEGFEELTGCGEDEILGRNSLFLQGPETDPDHVRELREARADGRSLVRLADNLVKNTVEHAGPEVQMRIGPLPDGFYYEDAGPGIPADLRESVVEPGFTTNDGGTGFGMVSIKQVVMAHGWSVSIGASPDGGVRFEFTGVEEL